MKNLKFLLPLALTLWANSVAAAGSSGKKQAPTAAAMTAKTSSLDEVQALVDSARYDEAIAKSRELLKSERSASLYTLMGFSLRKQKKFGEAVSAYTEALHIDPAYDQAKEYLAVAYLNVGQEKMAKDLYNDLSKSNPNLAEMLKTEAGKQGHKW